MMDAQQISKNSVKMAMENGHPTDGLETNLLMEAVAEPNFIGSSGGNKTALTNPQTIFIEALTSTQSLVDSFPTETSKAMEETVETCEEPADLLQDPPSTSALEEVYEPRLEEAVDDETTLDDEEQDGVADAEELGELERLGEMPLEELLRMYGAGQPQTSAQNVELLADSAAKINEDDQIPQSSQAGLSENNDVVQESGPSQSSSSSNEFIVNDEEEWATTDDEEDEDEEVAVDQEAKMQERLELLKFLARIGKQGDEGSDDSSDDDEFIPVHLMMLKRDVPIGPTHQVEAPEIDPLYEDNTCDPTDQIVQWIPKVSEASVRGEWFPHDRY